MVAFARQRMPTPTMRFQNAVPSSEMAYSPARPRQVVASNRANVDAPPAIQFSSIVYSANEGDGSVAVTINRTGDTSQPVNVDYATADSAGSQNCSVFNGFASSRCDYLSALGTLKFASGETSKTVSIQIIDDSYAEGPEIFTIGLSNPTSPAVLGSPTTAVVTINDNDTSNGVNPIDDATFFIHQQYLDFLNRQPDDSGLNFWSGTIASCGSDQQCLAVKRVNASGAFFLSIEFQNTGYLVYRIYKSAYGNPLGVPVPIKLNEFLADTQEIGQGVIVNQGNWQQQLENNKQALTLEFVQRSRFTGAFPATLTPAQFVDAMFANGGVTPSTADRNTAIAEFAGAVDTTDVNARSRALRDVADNSTLQQQEFNKAFVLMQYFGYLRRNPNDAPDSDFSGYAFWLSKLNSFGNYVDAEMVKAFILSGEYRQRFGGAGASSSPTPTPTPGPALTPEQTEAATEAVRAQFESLYNSGLSQDDVNQQLLAFIRSRPEFSDAGISSDSCVWATFTDGQPFVAYNNRVPDPAPGSTPQPAANNSVGANAKPEEVSDVADLQFGLGPAFENPTGILGTWLGDQSYGIVSGSGGTVESLRGVTGDRVLFLDGHGGPTDGSSPYGLSTLTAVSAAKERSDTDLAADLKAGRVYRAVEMYGRTTNNHYTFVNEYSITSKFIDFWWGNFAPKSFVYNSACSGASTAAGAFITAMKNKGLSVYAGWSRPSRGEEGAKFVFDRLLGGNHVYPEADGYQTRPFDYGSVSEDAQLHGVGKNLLDRSVLFIEGLSDSSTESFRTLAPSIESMSVDEDTNELFMDGDFGGEQGSVFVGGQEVDVKSWAADKIICNLPQTGTQSAGEVFVRTHFHKSNSAYISKWKAAFTHTVTGPGSLKQVDTYNVTLRADVRKYRIEIHKPPQFYGAIVDATQDSTQDYACSGAGTIGDLHQTWSGSGSLPRLISTPFRSGFTVGGSFEASTGLLDLSFNPAPGGFRIVTDDAGVVSGAGLFFVQVPGNVEFFSLTGDYSIIGATSTYSDGTFTHTLDWDNIQIQFAAPPDSPR
jgi:hypothetical protein